MSAADVFGTVVVGGGPAGTALLIAASKRGCLTGLARDGLVMVDRGTRIGGGTLGSYAITSDSTAETFLTAIKDCDHPEIAALADHPAALAVAEHVGALGVPLPTAALFLDALGEQLRRIVEEAGGEVRTRREAISAQRTTTGLWRTRLRRLSDGAEEELLSRSLVLAAGGHQPRWRIEGERVAGVALTTRYPATLVQSGEMFVADGFDAVLAPIAGVRAPRIVIIGGSTSALSLANKLLKDRPGLTRERGAITIAHRRPLRPYYPSAAAASADGFDDFTQNDICPVSGFVYRLGGFRLEARELILRQIGIGGRTPDPRVALHRLGVDDAATIALLDRADLIIAAFGYRPHALPLFDVGGERIATPAEALAYRPLVDGRCRVVDVAGRPVPGVYAIGLAAGFVPHGDLGGEASFSGQANGLWLWQNGVGGRIVDQLLSGEAGRAARRAVA